MKFGSLGITFFIGICGAVIGVKREVSVSAGIDFNLTHCLLVMSAFDGRAEREDRAGADKKGMVSIGACTVMVWPPW